jgi:uroporphyrinogen-III decarboxylase
MYAAEELEMLLKTYPEDFTGAGSVMGKSSRASGIPFRKGRYIDEWGCIWECGEDGVVGEVKNPMMGENWALLDSFTPPWEILENANWDKVNLAQDKNLKTEKKYMLLGCGGPFERMQFLRGTENLFADMADNTSEFRKLLEMVHEFCLREIEGWSNTATDAISFSDDWGSQVSLLISPEMWRDLFKPLYKQYCTVIHSAGKKVFMHSDGNITSIYQDLIDIGIDAINSQLFCMDIDEIARHFRGKITFWGEIDRQNVLPFGSPEDVHNAVRRVRKALDQNAGGVIAQCEWGSKTPAENIRAVFAAWDMPANTAIRI